MTQQTLPMDIFSKKNESLSLHKPCSVVESLRVIASKGENTQMFPNCKIDNEVVTHPYITVQCWLERVIRIDLIELCFTRGIVSVKQLLHFGDNQEKCGIWKHV